MPILERDLGENIVEILEDDTRFGKDASVVIDGWHYAVGVEFDIPGLKILALSFSRHNTAFPIQAFLGEADTYSFGAGCRALACTLSVTAV